ncbi:hypothetical protein [Actinotalea solisilvae]|uniref:hypothetical protein n=1 Tax=Actinotalea solisilvae TaxID=2072922 RepID=UPI0018F1C4FF|nr:hypothetical protein [Actinotalea solisilvae]
MTDAIEPRARDDGDARAWFYLDHRSDIEAWAELRTEGRDLVHRHLLELGPAVEELAVSVGAEPYEAEIDDGDRPRFGMRRREWVDEVLSQVAVVIEWQPSGLLGVGRGDPWPFVAVRYDAALDSPVAARLLESALAGVRRSQRGRASRWWPFWRYVEPEEGPALDPEQLSLACLRQLEDLWLVAAPALDGLRSMPVSRDDLV